MSLVVAHLFRSRFLFTPRLLPTLAAVIAVGLTLYLATWQQGRADEKRALQEKFDERVRMPPIKLDVATMINADENFRHGVAIGWQTQAIGETVVFGVQHGATHQ